MTDPLLVKSVQKIGSESYSWVFRYGAGKTVVIHSYGITLAHSFIYARQSVKGYIARCESALT